MRAIWGTTRIIQIECDLMWLHFIIHLLQSSFHTMENCLHTENTMKSYKFIIIHLPNIAC